MRYPLLFLFLSTALSMPAVGKLRVAVAANFKPTLTSIQAQWAASGGEPLLISSGSTGNLVAQIQFGAPYDVFLSADKTSIQTLEAKGFTTADSNRCYARGQLRLMGSDSLSALRRANTSIAIANPVTAPYGEAAQAVISQHSDRANPLKIIRANNVANAYQVWRSGNVDLAIVAEALFIADRKSAPALTATFASIAIPSEWYPPIDQHMAVISASKQQPAARAFLHWLASESSQAKLGELGYAACP